MGEDTRTLLQKIIDRLWNQPFDKMMYFFTKKWLDKHFSYHVGEKEYWGQFIYELLRMCKMLKP